jgi:ABC-type transporter Mla subunit MlaD
MDGFVDNINQLVASLRERDEGIEANFETFAKRLDRHRAALDRAEDQVSLLEFPGCRCGS